jgi:Tol biopolymer transport system component
VAFIVDNNLYAASRDGFGTATIISSRDLSVEGLYIASPDWSPSGEQLALVSNFLEKTPLVGTLYTVKADGGAFRPLVRETVDPDEKPSWSPDGSKIAYASHAGSGERDIWVVDVATRSAIRLTDHEAMDAFPAWEPTGFVPGGPPPSAP